MQTQTKLSILVLLLLTLPGLAQQTWEEFPPDVPGLKLIDRAYETIYANDQETHFYAVLYNGKNQSHVDIYRGLPWKKIYRWSVTFEGDPVKVRDRAALQISHGENDRKVTFYWNEYAGYAEAAVHLSLAYDLLTGTFSTSWSD